MNKRFQFECPLTLQRHSSERRASNSVHSGGSSHAADGEGRVPSGEAVSEVQEHTSYPFSAWSGRWRAPPLVSVLLGSASGESDCISVHSSQSLAMRRGYPGSASMSLPGTRQYSFPLKK